jgi:N-acetylglutamate synthase-like GNAT family acetyltransferase
MSDNKNIKLFELPPDNPDEQLVHDAAHLAYVEIGLKQLNTNPDLPEDPQSYLRAVKRERAFVAVDDKGVVVGMGALRDEKYDAELTHLAVDPSLQRNGEKIGSQILSLIETAARDSGHTELTLVPSDESKPFYAELDYSPTTDEELDPSVWTKTLK